MSRVGKGFFQGQLDLFGFKKIVHDTTAEAEKRRKAELGEGRKISLPERIAGFTASIQTVIGSATVGVSEQLVWARDAAQSNKDILVEAKATATATEQSKISLDNVVTNTKATETAVKDLVK